MANKIFGVDFTDDTNPASTWTLSLHNGTALRDVALSNLHKALTAFTGDSGSGGVKGIVPAPASGDSTKFLKGDGTWATPTTSTVKGHAQILAAVPPTTLGAPMNVLTGASSPAEQFTYWEFADSGSFYRDFLCRLINYNGGGLTVNFEVMRTSAAAGNAYVFQAAIRRINAASEDLGAAQTYDFNTVTITVPAGPPAATIPMSGAITFTNGADMDSVANNELFMLRLLRDPANASDNAGDTARVLTGLTIRET